jgi:hypothetical protein
MTEPLPDVLGTLEKLGTNADQVAQALSTKGIRGVRNSVRTLNPIVRYIRSDMALANDMDLILGNRLRISFPAGGKMEVLLPVAVVAFLGAFNRGAYPNLELPPDKT